MTSLSLVLWIFFGLALQLMLWLGIVFWRHWLDYLMLRSTVAVLPAAGELPATPTVLPVAWAGLRTFRVVRKVVEDAAQSICSFYLQAADEKPLPDFLPGQFLTFKLAPGGSGVAGQEIVRCYSLSDRPRADHYRVSIKRVPAPEGSALPAGISSNFFHDHIEVGSSLQVRAPAGHFHIDRSDAPVVLIGGGIGITPMLSMLNWCLAEQAGREIWLFYGVRNGREVVMKADLEALATAHPNFRLIFCFSDPLPEERAGIDFQYRGRVDVNLLRAQLPLKAWHFYICGPTPMMESLVLGLEEWGVPDARIHFEAFGPASIKRRQVSPLVPLEPVVDGGEAIVVTFAKSGKQLAWQSSFGNLLDFAEANSIRVESGCRAGGCGSCLTTILVGEVAYQNPPDFDPEPGSCLLCASSPKTSVTLEA